jgi:gliding motility-associated-like protein
VWAQTCPASPSPNSARGSFELLNSGDSSVLGANPRICAGTTLLVRDTTQAVNNQYWYEYTGTTAPTSGGDTERRHTFSRPGKYVVIQQGSLNGTGSYACQTIEVLPSPAPILSLTVCSVGEVRLSLPTNANNVYDEYAINWGDGSAEFTVPKAPQVLYHGYGAANAVYGILVRGVYAGGLSCHTLSRSINPSRVNTVRKPTIVKLTLTDATTATLDYTGQNGTTLEIFKQDATGTYQPTGLTSTTATVPPQTFTGLDSTRSTCFKVVAPQGCGPDAESEPLCALPLTVQALDLQNGVSWPAHAATPGFRNYTLTKNGTALAPLPNVSTTQYLDTQDVTCGQSYCYQLVAQVGTAQSISLRKCVVARSLTAPPRLTNVAASVVGGRVQLSWEPPRILAQTYQITRTQGGATFQPIGESKSETYLDASSLPASQTYCYRITYRDACQGVSPPSDPVCSILLRQDNSRIVWSAESPFTQLPGPYVVQLIDAAGGVLSATGTGGALSFEPLVNATSSPVLRYRVQTTAPDGTVSWSNELLFSLPIRLFVPDAFSPNGDGVNDDFTVQALFISTFQIRIFDRWGESVYASDNREAGWNGSYNGQPATPGTYSYRVEVTDLKGQTFVKRGLVLLVR